MYRPLIVNSQLWIMPTVASRSSSSVIESKSVQALIVIDSHMIGRPAPMDPS